MAGKRSLAPAESLASGQQQVTAVNVPSAHRADDPGGPSAASPPKRAASWRRYVNGLLAAEISTIARYCDRLVQWRPRSEDSGLLRELIDCPAKSTAATVDELPEADPQGRMVLLVHGNFNHDYDIEATLGQLKPKLGRTGRIVLVAYNSYFRWLYALANRLGIRQGDRPSTFLTHGSLEDVARLAGFEIVRVRHCVYFPWRLLGIGSLINRSLVALPIARLFALTAVLVLRPITKERGKPSLSIVVPARDERDNIRGALSRLPSFDGAEVEVVFVEGHSSDGTWEEIQQVISESEWPVQLKAFRQSGEGKADAVRLGFEHCEHELLTILDADLTMPPELLDRFYDAYCEGLADFVNGSRLVYPMEGGAMRFLNLLGNLFFVKALSFLLDARLGDCLCGTKLLRRDDYRRFVAWRQDFGDFDPFGDFELLFPASILGLGIVEVPVRYRRRTYGATSIRRFAHGAMLLRMARRALFEVKIGRSPIKTAQRLETAEPTESPADGS